MPCRDICAMLSAYIDDMLESPQVAQVEDHLAICEACRLECDNLRATVELVRGLPEVVPPPEFHDNLRQKLQAMPVPTIVEDQTGRPNRLARGKCFKTLAVAAVLFLSVGVTAFWYDKNEGGLFDTAPGRSTGQLMADREEQYGGGAVNGKRAVESGSESAQKQTFKGTDAVKEVAPSNNAADNTAGSTVRNAAGSVDRGGGPAASGVPVSERPRAAWGASEEQSTPAVGGGGSDTADEGERADRDFAVQENQPENNEHKFFITAAPENIPRDAAPRLDNSSLQAADNVAREFTATVMLTERKDTVEYWDKAAGRYDGFIDTDAEQTGQCLVLRIPTGNLDGFIEDLNNMGQVDIKSETKDLTVDVHQTEEQLNVLREREKALVEQQETGQTENGAASAAELDALRDQIARQQQILLDLQEDINFATINLYIK